MAVPAVPNQEERTRQESERAFSGVIGRRGEGGEEGRGVLGGLMVSGGVWEVREGEDAHEETGVV